MFPVLKRRNTDLVLFLIVVFCIAAALLMAVPAFAQEPTPTPVIPAELDLNGVTQAFLVFVVGTFGAWITSPATVTIVGALKRYVFTKTPEQGGISGDTLALVVGVLLAALTAALAFLGFEQEWRTGLQIAIGVVTVLTGVGLNLTRAGKSYQAAKAENAPITGYSRVTGNDTPKPA